MEKNYLCNKRYGLSPPLNAEVIVTRMDMENFLCGKKQRNNQRYDHYLICLGNKDIISYASRISSQQMLLPLVTGWRSKQRYFRRNTSKQVLETLLDNKEVFEHAMKQFDFKLNPKLELKLITHPMRKK